MAPTLHLLLGDLATDRATKRAYRDDRQGWLAGQGHDLPPELVDEAITHVASRLPVEVAEQLSDHAVSTSAVLAGSTISDPLAGLDALATARPGGVAGPGAGGGGPIVSSWGWIIGVIAVATIAGAAWFALRDGGSPPAEDVAVTSTAPVEVTAAPVESTLPPQTSVESTLPPSSTTEPPPPAIGVTGTWELLIVVTSAGACEVTDAPYTATVTIEQKDDNSVTVVGLGDGDAGWIGVIEGDRLEFGGKREEDDGTTSADFELDVSADQQSVTGTEFWDWSRVFENGNELRCGPGLSTVTGTRLG